ncbi:putative SCP-like extracellular domain protein [Toxoplasma gondii VAND]|uniref:Putative SCP-like extracellular domain protein n=1 Tax=Toxoplasma gondii VAND TaxID=933077 RepID=A0A086Q828_TOXGO|nr:putative SCP-like extracellular domain protein [Toxoplasma gondii VAND]
MGDHTNTPRIRCFIFMLALVNFVSFAERVDAKSVQSQAVEDTAEATFLPIPREAGTWHGRELEKTHKNDEAERHQDTERDEKDLREQEDKDEQSKDERDSRSSGQDDGKRESEEKEELDSEEPDSDDASRKPFDAEADQRARHATSVTSECLRFHNLFRVGQLDEEALEPLHAHAGMDSYVLALMERLAASNCSQRAIPENLPFGVNVYATTAARPSCVRASHLWYRGIDSFKGQYPGTDWRRGTALQFVQMMWSSSEYVACARTENCTRGMNQLVCLYYPPGNDIREAPFSEETWNAILRRHHQWLDYGAPGGRRDRPNAATSNNPREDDEVETL